MAVVLHNQKDFAGISTCSVQIHVENVPERFMLLVAGCNDKTRSISTTPIWRPNSSDIGTNQPLTLLGSYSPAGSANFHYEVWGLLNPNPSTATNSFVGTYNWGAIGPLSIQTVTVWSGVDQTTPWTGYPGLPTNLVSQEVVNSPTAVWAALSVPSVSGDYVVDAAFTGSGGTKVYTATAGQTSYQNRYTDQSGQNIYQLVSAKTATGATTAMSWAGPTAGLSFMQMAFPLKPSVSTAPYFVEPAWTNITLFSDVGAATLTVKDTTNFPASGYLELQEVNSRNAAANYIPYSAKTATTFTLVGTQGVTMRIGQRVTEVPSASAVGTSLSVLMPLSAALNDIMVVNLYAAEAGAWTVPVTHPGPGADFTLINSGVSTYRQDTYWRRISAADIATPPTFTFTGTASVQRNAAVALYRGCTTAGSPIGTGTAAPTTNSGASAAATATGLTTTAANMTIVGLYAVNGTGTIVWSPAATQSERVENNQVYLSDSAVLLAGATGDQVAVSGDAADGWLAQLVALIAASAAGITYNRSLTRTGSVTDSPSKASSTYHKTASRTGAISEALAKIGTYHKALTRTGTIAVTLKNIQSIFHRTLTRTGSVVESLSKAGSTYHKALSRAGAVVEVVSFVKNSVVPILRSLTRSGTVNVSVKKSGSTYHKSVSRTGTVVELTSRRLSVYRRSATRTGVVTESVKKTGVYHKILTRTGSVLELVTQTITSVGLSFFTFGSFPILRLWEPAEFISPTVFFEADLFSSNTNTAYARLFDVTANSAVSGSQIQTSSPHNSQQRVRSGAISLVSGHVYRAEVGRASGSVATIAAADLIVEVP